mgnify:CR=1 FL=1
MSSKFLGTTRFSLFEPDSPSWRLSRRDGRDDADRYRQLLYSPERMKSRMEIFFDQSLPQLDLGSAGYEYLHVVSYSHELPQKYLAHLENAAARYSWLRLDCRTPTDRRGKSMEKWALEEFSPGDIYAEFRLDDDDLLAPTYFETVSNYLTNEHVGFYVSLGLGIQAFYADERFLEPRLEHRPKIAIGLARVCRVDSPQKTTGPKRVAHTQIDRHVPVIIDSQKVQYLHSIHLSQDSGVDKPEGDLGNRIRNYLNQPEPESDLISSLFPRANFGAMSELDQFRLLLGAHTNLDTLRSSLLKLRRRVVLPATIRKKR